MCLTPPPPVAQDGLEEAVASLQLLPRSSDRLVDALYLSAECVVCKGCSLVVASLAPSLPARGVTVWLRRCVPVCLCCVAVWLLCCVAA